VVAFPLSDTFDNGGIVAAWISRFGRCTFPNGLPFVFVYRWVTTAAILLKQVVRIGKTIHWGNYVQDLSGNLVSPSVAVAGIALRCYRREGFQQPPAGVKYPVRGVIEILNDL
jgi:hypothetical protein